MKSVILAICLSCASEAAADERDLYIQMRLVKEGFLENNTDGKFGSASRAAMAAYVEKFGLSKDDKDTVAAHMQAMAGYKRVRPVPPELWATAVESAKSLLLDPFSAVFTPLYTYKDTKGGNVVCGTVNGKNLYGAYVGEKCFEYLFKALGPTGWGLPLSTRAQIGCAS